jgi:hypothetical protein
METESYKAVVTSAALRLRKMLSVEYTISEFGLLESNLIGRILDLSQLL